MTAKSLAALFLLALFLIGCGAVLSEARHQFQTAFPATENPISEGGRWLNGATVGLDWNDVQTTGGSAIGVGPASVTVADPEAILNPATTGPWGPDQQAIATVFTGATVGMFFPEVELRLNSTMTAHNSTGYEFYCSVLNHPNPEMAIVRWNGALGDFAVLAETFTSECGNDDVLKATNIGGNLSFYRNGTLMVTAVDYTFANGAPGIGFNAGSDNTYANSGFTRFSAQDITAGGGGQ